MGNIFFSSREVERQQTIYCSKRSSCYSEIICGLVHYSKIGNTLLHICYFFELIKGSKALERGVIFLDKNLISVLDEIILE